MKNSYIFKTTFALAFTMSLAACGGDDETDFGDGSNGRVGDCIVSDGGNDELIGSWELEAIQGVPNTAEINGPLIFYSTGSFDFTLQVDSEAVFANITNSTGSFSFSEIDNSLATTGTFSSFFGSPVTIEFCNDNTQFTFVEAEEPRARYTYVRAE